MRLTSLILIAMTAAPAAADRINVPGTRVDMDPPDGYVLATDFPGFISSNPRSTITVVEVPSSFIELTQRYDDDGLRREGIAVSDRRQFERDGLRAVIITGEENADSRPLIKKMFMTGDVAESLVVTASYLKKDAPRIADSLEHTLRNLLWDSSRLLDHFDGIGFRLKEIPGLRVATRVSNSIIFTRDGTLPDQYYTGQMLIVGWSKGDVTKIGDKRAYAEKRFRDVALLLKAHIDNTESVTRDGVDGFETVGKGTHRHLGFEVAAYQLMLNYPDRILLAQGFANVKDPEAAFDQFRTIMGTISTDE